MTYTCGWKGCTSAHTNWKIFRNHVQGHTKRNSSKLMCLWQNCPESNREYLPNEKYLLALHASKHIEETVKEQDKVFSTNFAIFLGKKRASIQEGGSESGSGPGIEESESGNLLNGGGANEVKRKHQVAHPQQTMYQKRFTIRSDSEGKKMMETASSMRRAAAAKEELGLQAAVQRFSRPVGSSSSSRQFLANAANATPAQILDEAQKALNSPSVTASEEKDATVTTEEFLNLSLTEAISYLEGQQANSLESSHRGWLSSVASRMPPPENGMSTLASQIQGELDQVALLFHNHLTPLVASSADFAAVTQHLRERSAAEKRAHHEVSQRYKKEAFLFKDLAQFETVFEEFHREAKEIAERASKRRRMSLSSTGGMAFSSSSDLNGEGVQEEDNTGDINVD